MPQEKIIFSKPQDHKKYMVQKIANVQCGNQAFFTEQENKMCLFCIKETEIKLFKATLMCFLRPIKTETLKSKRNEYYRNERERICLQ